MITRFLFNTVKILVIWVIIGVAISYGFSYLKPIISSTFNSVEKKSGPLKPLYNKLKNKINMQDTLKLTNKIVADTKKHINRVISSDQKTNKLLNISVPPTKKITQSNASYSVTKNIDKETELFQRQMSIIDELTK
ncbi:MAG: hypothetical protein GY756_05245 [bacterium]|nr:hypothetical protein [bacterium]